MYTTDLITLPRFCFGRGVYARFPALCRELGSSFVVVGGCTAMEKGLPPLKDALKGSGMTLLAALPFAVTDPVFPEINYLLTPLHVIARMLLFFAVSLVMELVRRRTAAPEKR